MPVNKWKWLLNCCLIAENGCMKTKSDSEMAKCKSVKYDEQNRGIQFMASFVFIMR